MKQLTFLLLSLLLSPLAFAQPYTYQSWKNADGTVDKYRQSRPGYLVYDQKVLGNLPAGTTPSRTASRFLYPYAPEADAVVNYSQFGSDLYYSPSFKFALDWGGHVPINQRRRWGMNLFQKWSIKADYSAYFGPQGVIDWASQLQAGEGMFYFTQNGLGYYANTANFFTRTLSDFVSGCYNQLPAIGYGEWANYKYFVFNLETTVFNIYPGQHNPDQNNPNPPYNSQWDTQGYFDDWNGVKNQPFKMESTGETTTLEQLANRGRGPWQAEMFTRRANRMAALPQLVKLKANPAVNVQVSIGYAPYVSWTTSLDAQNSSGSFFEGTGNVSNIGGDGSGNITLNIPGKGNTSLNLSGDGLKYSDFIQGYRYEDHPELLPQDEADFLARKSGTQSYPWFWSRVLPVHTVALEKGWIQINRQIVANRTGKPKQGVLRQTEPVYEWGRYRIPFAGQQGVGRYGNTVWDTPRLWVPPVTQGSIYMVSRFFAGNDPGWGYYLFPVDPPDVAMDPNLMVDANGKKWYGHALHPISAILQARRDMQPYEQYYTGSTLIEDPEVLVGETGNWSAYTGTEAYNYNGGKQGVKRPAYMMRHKPVPGGFRVLILGGMEQADTQERIDQVRVPNNGLSGNKFRIKLRGSQAHILEFFVPTGASNQTFEALPVAASDREKAGYRGWTSN